MRIAENSKDSLEAYGRINYSTTSPLTNSQGGRRVAFSMAISGGAGEGGDCPNRILSCSYANRHFSNHLNASNRSFLREQQPNYKALNNEAPSPRTGTLSNNQANLAFTNGDLSRPPDSGISFDARRISDIGEDRRGDSEYVDNFGRMPDVERYDLEADDACFPFMATFPNTTGDLHNTPRFADKKVPSSQFEIAREDFIASLAHSGTMTRELLEKLFDVAHATSIASESGVVKVASSRQSKVPYALKFVEHAAIDGLSPDNAALNELLAAVQLGSHPFIGRHLAYAEFDDGSGKSFLFVQLFYRGGSLASNIAVLNASFGSLFPWLPFIIAEVAIALDYLGERGIVHRRISASNILLDSRGHVKIIDFKACVLVRGKALQSAATSPILASSTCKTSTADDTAQDWYALGALIVHAATGVECAANDDPMNAAHFKKLKMHPLAKSLVNELCASSPAKRLKSLASLRKHSFFAGVDWAAMMTRPLAANAPFVPKQTKRLHCSSQ